MTCENNTSYYHGTNADQHGAAVDDPSPWRAMLQRFDQCERCQQNTEQHTGVAASILGIEDVMIGLRKDKGGQSSLYAWGKTAHHQIQNRDCCGTKNDGRQP